MKAKDLHKHTLLLTNNENKFTVNYRELTASICRHSEEVFIKCYLANEIFAKSKEAVARRVELQTEAIQSCDALLALIDLAYSFFKLRGKAVEYWSSLVIEERELITAWKRSESIR